MSQKSHLGKLAEVFFVIVIVLAIIETFAEEYAAFADLAVRARKYLIIAGFAVDLIFSLEFLIRFVIAGSRGGVLSYMRTEGGFIDFVSSFPLLILSSGPMVWMTFFSAKAGFIPVLAGLSFMKAVKVIRVVRTLRFARTLKFPGRFKRRYSMTPVFVARAVSLSITVVILALIGFAFVSGGKALAPKSSDVKKVISNSLKGRPSVPLNALIGGTESVIFIKKENKIIYQSMQESSFQARFMGDDYSVQAFDAYQVYFNDKDVKRTEAFINMLAFSIILGILLFMVTFYRFFFNRHVSAVLATMIRGFKTAGYSTAVRINESRAEFEVYQMADQYNRKWLPLKRKILEVRRGR